jgi:hypothetical protein
MPGDPKECRQHAANCKRLAENATTPEAREHFFSLAAQWEKLASALESAKAFLEAVAEMETKKPSGPSASADRKA